MTKQKIISYLYPQELERVHSNFNGTIHVMQFLGKPYVVVDELTQSGGLVTKIWTQVVDHLTKHEFKRNDPRTALILGLGAGSMVKKLTYTWPHTVLTGIELDPAMIDIGKRYFDLTNYQLTIINQDALKWLSATQDTFDLILIDLYKGKESTQLTNNKFITQIADYLSPQGIAIFNQLTLKDMSSDTNNVEKRLNDNFKHVTRIPTSVNRLLKVSNHP